MTTVRYVLIIDESRSLGAVFHHHTFYIGPKIKLARSGFTTIHQTSIFV